MDILGGAVSLYTQPQLPRILQKPVGWIRFPSVPVQVLEEADVRRVMGVSACEGWREGAGIECEVCLPPVKREGPEGGLPRKSLRPRCGPEKISTRLLGSPRIEMHPPRVLCLSWVAQLSYLCRTQPEVGSNPGKVGLWVLWRQSANHSLQLCSLRSELCSLVPTTRYLSSSKRSGSLCIKDPSR